MTTCSHTGMIRIWKMKPESRIAGSIEAIRPAWNASACVLAIVEISRPKPSAPNR